MAKESYLEILKQGVDVWNQWREDNPDIKHPDLSWADFSGANLYWVNLKGADLTWSNFSNCELVLADMSGADLTRATLKDANLTKADFTNATLDSATLIGANLTRAKFNNANLNSANLSKSDMEFAELNDADLRDAVFDDANLKDADLGGTNLEGTSLLRAELKNTILADTGFNEPPKKGRAKWIALAALGLLLVILGLVFLPGYFSKRDVIITLPKDTPAYVYWDGKPLVPAETTDDYSRYQISGSSLGAHQLTIFGGKISDFQTDEFTRYRRYDTTLTIIAGDSIFYHPVSLQPLYSINKVANGLTPSIDPEGKYLIYTKTGRLLNTFGPEKKLYFFDIEKSLEHEILLDNPSVYDVDWEWDRPSLLSGGKTAYLSGYNYLQKSVGLFRISVENGNISRIPFKLKKKWLRYIPASENDEILIENKRFSSEGQSGDAFTDLEPYKDILHYGGENGVLFFAQPDSQENQNRFLLDVIYQDFNSKEHRPLWQLISTNQLPALSASNNGERIVVTHYQGVTKDFFSKIQLWMEGEFVDLTRLFLDGERNFSDGTYVHQIAAVADSQARRIVFEYESNIYLINIPVDVTLADFKAADMPQS